MSSQGEKEEFLAATTWEEAARQAGLRQTLTEPVCLR